MTQCSQAINRGNKCVINLLQAPKAIEGWAAELFMPIVYYSHNLSSVTTKMVAKTNCK